MDLMFKKKEIISSKKIFVFHILNQAKKAPHQNNLTSSIILEILLRTITLKNNINLKKEVT